MPIISENKYLQSLLENLIVSYETETNYSPIEIELDPQQITKKDIPVLLKFLTETRKRLFIFKIQDDKELSNYLALSAQRYILNQTAEIILENTANGPKINPLKQALDTPDSSVRAGIQIQKSFALSKQTTVFKNINQDHIEQIATPDIVLLPVELPELPVLCNQLKVLGIQNLQDIALVKIKKHAHAFTDGINPGNLPTGFYICSEKNALCFTSNPRKLPTALAPMLELLKPFALPSMQLTQALLPDTISQNTITQLLTPKNIVTQKNALLRVLPAYTKEINAFLLSLKSDELHFIIPLLSKMFILGGEAHTCLFSRLLNACVNKKISLEFLKKPGAEKAFVNPRGIKNLQKLLQLPAEQKEWWNVLVKAHLKNNQHQFDFNSLFEAYSQIFLPRICEKNLTLPQPCPIQHDGHLLITLNRVLDVLEHAQNPQEQCFNLQGLNWGPLGVHYAMTQNPDERRLKQIAACMKIQAPEDTIINLDTIYQNITTEKYELHLWLYRYMGQHWKKEIRLNDINAQFTLISKQPWDAVQKNHLLLILTSSFSNETKFSADEWKSTLQNCINLIQPLSSENRDNLLEALSRSFKFKPNPSLSQIQQLIKQCIDLKAAFPYKNFKAELLEPLISCLENEGFEMLNILQERIQKTEPTPADNKFPLTLISSFTTVIFNNHDKLSENQITLLAKINEPELIQTSIDNLLLSFKTLQTNKSESFYELVTRILSQLNISKSQPLPNCQQIQDLINTLSTIEDPLPAECITIEKQEAWLKDLIIEKNLLPGCVFGNGDISKLDDLIVDALVDAVKKRSAALDIPYLKECLFGYLQTGVFKDLREQLNTEFIPVLDALNDLITLLQSPKPQFEQVIKKISFFEEKKPLLLEAIYDVPVLGSSKGEYIVSYLLTGKRKKEDEITTAGLFRLEWSLQKLHNEVFVQTINNFFEREENSNIKDWDAQTCFSWMTTLNKTLNLTFFFKEELIQKKVLPALTKTLQQLNTQDPLFEKSILEAAASINENEPSDQSLKHYRNKIESIAQYLNLLIDIKDRYPIKFNAIFKQLYTGALARIDYPQKQILINTLLEAAPESLGLFLTLAISALEENPLADSIAIERSITNLVTLFKLEHLEPETQIMFFKMSMAYNLKNPSPFPLKAISELKKSPLPEQTKSLIIKRIIQILTRLPNNDSPALIQGLVQQTQSCVTLNPDFGPLCIALLQRVCAGDLNEDLNIYPHILQQLSLLKPNNKKLLANILTNLANNRKDDTVNMASLLEITRGLGRRTPEDIEQVHRLFATPPYPLTRNLNSALLAHGSEKLQAYCLNFDKNPFANTGEKRDLHKQFTTNRIKDALLSLKDLNQGTELPHALQLQLAKQLTYIETLGYTDPLNPNDYQELKKLTQLSRHDLKVQARNLLLQCRTKTLSPKQVEIVQLELLAYLREIYFRSTGLFPNTTQMLVLLLSLHDPNSNLLMRIKTGEGKSINTPMLSVLQWAQGGTVDQVTANPTLLIRDYENSCEPFFNFLGIKSTLIQSNSPPEDYQLDGINCSTIEDMAIFRLSAKESKKEHLIQNNHPIHLVLDECDDALLDQTTLYKLVGEQADSDSKQNNTAQWIYPLTYQFINLTAFRNINLSTGKVWDEEEDLEQFRLFLNKEIIDQFDGDVEKQNFLMACSNTQLMQWIHASCKAALLIENKHFIAQPVKEKDEAGNETTKKIVCVPLIRSTPKTGSILNEGVQQALQARLKAERKDQAHFFVIDADPPVLASQSARGLVRFYQETKGRLVGVSATPGDQLELQSLSTLLGTQAIGIAPYAGDHRKMHAPVFTFSNKETIGAIHQAIDSIKLPVTKPKMEINTDAAFQTHEEREVLIAQTKKAIDEWNKTQTQPILIVNEDFDESQTIGLTLDVYKKGGFKIQIVTGKESPEELDHIIKQAGHANTITVGTAMLAKGIDINPGNHPKGLIVIQTYPDSERMTTQIAGRAARNGKPGGWLPIYQIKTPQSFVEKILYYIFPWYRQSNNERSVAKLQNKIKLQATVDRLYTQAIDETQQILMQQIYAWEGLLLELHPADSKLQSELYQWREAILSELNRLQDTTLTQDNLEASIIQFKNSACKLWETMREDKWSARTQKAIFLTQEQNLRISYLKQLDFNQELNIQSALQQKTKQFTVGTKALIHQNLETVLRDKAGAVLDYTSSSNDEKQKLQIAQSKQLLPNLIGEFCSIYPESITQFIPKNKDKNSSFISEMLNLAIVRVIKQKNKVLLRTEERQQIIHHIIQYYEKELLDADSTKIQTLLQQMKSLLLQYNQNLAHSSLLQQFKIQGLILTFNALYQNSGLPQDTALNALKTSYDNEIMKKLAEHLLHEMAWVKTPQTFDALLERSVAKDAALALYTLAEELSNNPRDKNKIHALYACLQEHRIILQNKYLFSFRHTCPRQVINTALAAIDSLKTAPHCNFEFRNNCHDTVLAEYHLAQFRNLLRQMTATSNTTEDPVWEHLVKHLTEISAKKPKNQSYVIWELNQTIERFNTYKAYQPYKNQLHCLVQQITASINKLNQDGGFKEDFEENLLKEKALQFANLFQIDSNNIRIQKGTDGLHSFIEMQIKNTPLKEHFTGYQSSFFSVLENEKSRLALKQSIFKTDKNTLFDLSDSNAMNTLTPEQKLKFEKLTRLKKLINQNWNTDLNSTLLDELPETMKHKINSIQQLAKWNWMNEPVNLDLLKSLLGNEPESVFIEKLAIQHELNKSLEEIHNQVVNAIEIVNAQQSLISGEEASIQIKQTRIQDLSCGYIEKIILNTQIYAMNARLIYYKHQLSEPQLNLANYEQDEIDCIKKIKHVNHYLDDYRKEFITIVTKQTQKLLDEHLNQTFQNCANEIQSEIEITNETMTTIEKAERKKSRYQTRRFFSPTEILNYQASLINEEGLIPQAKVQTKVHENKNHSNYQPAYTFQ